MKRGYVDAAHGQIHFHHSANLSAERKVWVCMPPVPYGGAYFENLDAGLSPEHAIIAIDPPGYGASDAVENLTVEANAAAAFAVIEALGVSVHG